MINTGKLLRLRYEKNISRCEAAKCMGMWYNTLYIIESREGTNPKIKTLKSIADFYGVTVDEILN